MLLLSVLGSFLIFGVDGIPGRISLEDGGYEGLLVDIKDDVVFDDRIIPAIKDQFVKASEDLYRATLYNEAIYPGSLCFFKEVTVFVPHDWPVQDICSEATTETQSSAHFVVENDSEQWPCMPHTDMCSTECGKEQQGKVHIPKSFLTDNCAANTFGDKLGKVLVHEWSHKRYGLFDESTSKEGKFNCEMPPGGGRNDHVPVRCSTSINGMTRSLNEHGCLFTHREIISGEARGSLMFYGPEFFPKVETFCDAANDHDPTESVTHDFEVDHDHNRLCQGKTGWEILRHHPDFTNPEGPPFDADKDFEADLTFQCRQKGSRQVVLVMDVSGSMKVNDRMLNMQSSVAMFLDNLYQSGDNIEVGMVEFQSTSAILSYLIPLDSQENLDELLRNIPIRTTGETCIGCGINDAIDILEYGGRSANGGELFIFTDGEENKTPKIREVRNSVLAKQIIVFGLLLDTVMDNHDLITLSVDSGGSYCIFTDDGTDFYDCLNDLNAVVTPNVPFEISNEENIVPPSSSFTDNVPVDSSFNKHLRFTLSWKSEVISNRDGNDKIRKSLMAQVNNTVQELTTLCDNLDLLVTSPQGNVIDNSSTGYTRLQPFKTVAIQSFDHTEGTWDYEITNPGAANCPFKLRIEGFADRNESVGDLHRPLAMTTSLSTDVIVIDNNANPLDNAVKFYAHVLKGRAPVIGAQVTVHVETIGRSFDVDLLDNGAGADLHPNDGIYSRYFMQYTRNGMYHARFFANGTEDKTSILQEKRIIDEVVVDGDSSSIIVKTTAVTPCENFQRSAMGGMFEVQGVPQGGVGSIFPPARISDLHVLEQNDNVSVLLSWTAVGENLDQGTAAYYDMRVGDSVLELIENFTMCMQVNESYIIVGSLLHPLASGEVEMMDIDVKVFSDDDIWNGTYFVALQAVDSSGNHGATSNVAAVRTINPDPGNPQPTPDSTDPGNPQPTPDSTSPGNPQPTPDSTDPGNPQPTPDSTAPASSEQALWIFGAVCIVVVISVVVMASVFVVVKHRSKTIYFIQPWNWSIKNKDKIVNHQDCIKFNTQSETDV